MDSCARPAVRFRPPAAGGRGSAGQNILGLILGVAFTLGLFLSIAHYEKAAPESPPPELDDLRVAVVPVQPPPLPSVTPTESAPDTTPMVDFEYAPSDSVVKIAASPPSAASVLPEELSRAPSANASFDQIADVDAPASGTDQPVLSGLRQILIQSTVSKIALVEKPAPENMCGASALTGWSPLTRA